MAGSSGAYIGNETISLGATWSRSSVFQLP